MKKVFYHVSTLLTKDGVFKPRIPLDRLENENSSIARVCVAESIEGCLSAFPDGGKELLETLYVQEMHVKVFRIDAEKLGIREEDIFNSSRLYTTDLVADAENNKENWILREFVVPEKDQYIIKLKSWEDSFRPIIPYNMMLKIQEYYGEKYFSYDMDPAEHLDQIQFYYEEIVDGLVSESPLIIDLQYELAI
ncbi:hypothetical protein [Bacillus cereus]|uniref:Uncharacterized protein n=1 Tax=Bacillus cereus TaxID=1396 RepID=A0A164NCV5_BACCE|nr:hypothetical protein [Bacillus cereus]KZD63358.1 hypothetical protein B4088_3343 [Bacillus cereus]